MTLVTHCGASAGELTNANELHQKHYNPQHQLQQEDSECKFVVAPGPLSPCRSLREEDEEFDRDSLDETDVALTSHAQRTETQKMIARAAATERYAGDSQPDIKCKLKHGLASTDIGDLISGFLSRQVKVYNGFGLLRGILDLPREEVAELTCGQVITRARACGLIEEPSAGDVWVVEVRMLDLPPTRYGYPCTRTIHPNVRLFNLMKRLGLSGLEENDVAIFKKHPYDARPGLYDIHAHGVEGG